jgi:hypothetical protein
MVIKSMLIFILLISHLEAITQSENVLKAIFITRFIQFSQWPAEENYFEKQDKFYIVNLTKQKDLNQGFKSTFSSVLLKGKIVEYTQIKNISEIGNADVIYINNDCLKLLPELLKSVKGKPILIIGDSPGLCQKGGHVNMYITKTQTLGYEINLKAYEQSGIKPQAGLLRMGKIVNNE